MTCPEALYGAHGDPNTRGKCPYCGAKIAAPRQYGPRRGSLSISYEQEAYLDSRRREQDRWGQIVVPVGQDPLEIDMWSSDDRFYE